MPSMLLAKHLRRWGGPSTARVGQGGPLTRLAAFATTGPGKAILVGQLDTIERYKQWAGSGNGGGVSDTDDITADLDHVLGAIHLELGNAAAAVDMLQAAIARDDEGSSSGCGASPDAPAWRWLLEIASLQLASEQARERAATVTVIATALRPPRSVRQVARRDAKGLSAMAFFREFSAPRVPVIITGLVTTRSTWTLGRIVELAGHRKVTVKRNIPDSVEWVRDS